MLCERLRGYSAAPTYPDAFLTNLNVVNTADQSAALRALLVGVASLTGVPYELVAIDFKRYLLNNFELDPQNLARGLPYLGRALGALGVLAAQGTFQSRARNTDVLIDMWMPSAAAVFYSPRLVRELQTERTVAQLDVSHYHLVDARDLAPLIREWPRITRLVRGAATETGLDFSHYAYRAAKDHLAGRSIRRRFAPKVLLSGNDGGISPIRAASAGADLIYVQNGVRGWLADSSFVYADAYFAIEGPRLLPVRSSTHCRLGEVESVGSIMLSHHLARRSPPGPPTHDITFVSSLEASAHFDQRFSHYAMAHELEAIRHINALAEGGATVAYYPRNNDEVAHLRRLGLASSAVHYLQWRPLGVYPALEAGRAVLSTFSTVGLEALALGRAAGYLNFSGNRLLNGALAETPLEYTPDSFLTVREFVDKLAATRVNTDTLINQSGDVVRAVVKRVLERSYPVHSRVEHLLR